MIDVRRATAADAAEIIRLREIMLTAMCGHESADHRWRRTAAERLPDELAAKDPTLVAFVVDCPDRPGALAACAVGAVEYRLGGPDDPGGESGYVFSVATDPDQRRRGHSRRCVTALLDWYRVRGVATVDLNSSADGEPLYRSLGFVPTPDPSMRLTLRATGA